MGILVRSEFVEGYDLELGQLKFAVKLKNDRIDGRVLGAFAPEEPAARWTRAMNDLNIIFREPVCVQVKREAAQQDGYREQNPIFSRHTCKLVDDQQPTIFELNERI